MMKKFFIKILLIVLIILLNYTIVVNGMDYGSLYNFEENSFTKIGTSIAGWIGYGVLAIAVVMLMVTGIQFIISAPDGKAQAMKRLIPWAIGVFILLCMEVIIQRIVDTAQNINYI